MDPVIMHKLSWHDKVILPKSEPVPPKQTNQYVGPRGEKCTFSFLEKGYSDRSKLLYAVSTF